MSTNKEVSNFVILIMAKFFYLHKVNTRSIFSYLGQTSLVDKGFIKLSIYEFHMMMKLHAKEVITVKDATYAVAKKIVFLREETQKTCAGKMGHPARSGN